MSKFVKATLHPENTSIAIRKDTIITIVQWIDKDEDGDGKSSSSSSEKKGWDIYTTDKRWIVTYESGLIIFNTINGPCVSP